MAEPEVARPHIRKEYFQQLVPVEELSVLASLVFPGPCISQLGLLLQNTPHWVAVLYGD